MPTHATQPPSIPIVLASSSPFRRELLSRLGLPFVTASPHIDESPQTAEPPEATALRLAEAKARTVAQLHPAALIIGSDQLAILDSKIYGKPGSHAAAVAQLRHMQGKTVQFFTALCLFNSRSGKIQLRGIPTFVTFRTLNEQEIENYVHREPAYDCAGSAKTEGLGITLINRITGDDPNALIGLPLIALCDFLREEGVTLL